MNETLEFVKWYELEKNKGLVDIKFVPGDSIKRDTTRDDFAAGNNRVNRLIANNQFVQRPDVF